MFALILLGVAGGVVGYKFPEKSRQYLPATWCDALGVRKTWDDGYVGSTVSVEEWADGETLRRKLRGMVDERLTGTDAEAVRAFLTNPENRLILEQDSLINSELASRTAWEKDEKIYVDNLVAAEKQVGAIRKGLSPGTRLIGKKLAQEKAANERIQALRSELAKPHSLAQIVADPFAKRTMQLLGNNLHWLNQFSSSGECTRPGVAVSILAQIAKKYPDFADNRVERDMATAAAIEFARHGWTQDDAVERAGFFIRNHRSHRLNKIYDKLPFHHRRILGGYKGMGKAADAVLNDSVGSAANLQWCLDHVHLPADRYLDCCWQCSYQTTNIYGESIYGSAPFYDNFLQLYPDQFCAATYAAGGVCGGLSHFGAASALANGIPATTSGEPGHCSYIVLVGGRWTPAYSMSWERELHIQPVSGIKRYSQLHLVDRMFSSAETEATQLSQAMRKLGDMYADIAPEKAKTFYEGATRAQPINYYAWRDYARFLARMAPKNADAWISLCSSVNKNFAPVYPEMAAELLVNEVYAGLKTALGSDMGKHADILCDFWKHVSNMGPDSDWDPGNKGRWAVEALAEAQMALLGTDPQKDLKGVEIFAKIAQYTKDSSVYSPVILAWGNSLADKADLKLRRAYTQILIDNIGSGDDGTSDREREKMLRSLIAYAEQSGDITAFHSLARALPKKYHQPNAKGPLPAFQPFAEKIVSQGGLVRVSHPHPAWNNECFHWGILEPGVGGHFCTDKVENPCVTITLPKQAYVSGIIIITTPESRQRLNHMKVQVSETGADNDWKDLVEDLGECKQQVLRADVSASKPRAKYVRILRPGGPEYFHLMAIYVYGEPAA